MTSPMATGINAALTVFLRDFCGVNDVREVTGFEQYKARGGNCSTCAWSEIRVRIDYAATGDGEDSYEYRGDMGALMRALAEAGRGIDAANRDLNDVLNLLGPPPGWKP